MLSVQRADLSEDPFPHLLKDGILEPGFYADLKREFPGEAAFERMHNERNYIQAGGRRNLGKSDAGFNEFVAGSPAWRRLLGWIESPAFIRLNVDLFADLARQRDCRFEFSRARYSDHRPRRYPSIPERVANKLRLGELWRGGIDRLNRALHPDDLFVDFHFARGQAGYAREIHTDNPYRFAVMLIYFCNKEEVGEGGELALHKHRVDKPHAEYEQFPSEADAPEFKLLGPADNRGALFLNCHNAFHSVTPQRGAPGKFRNFIYVGVSARSNIWRVAS